MALDSKSGSRKINQNVDLAPGARNLTTTGNITAGAFYGDGSNLSGISTASANDALITIVAGGGLTGGGGFTVDQAVDADITKSLRVISLSRFIFTPVPPALLPKTANPVPVPVITAFPN